MEILLKATTFTIFSILFALPIVLLTILYKRNFKNILFFYTIISIITTFLLFLVAAWWTYYSNKILMSYYGYDFQSMNFEEGLKNVSPQNIAKTKTLHQNTLGIGWPLKAFISFPLYIPYLLFVYLTTLLYRKVKLKSK
ncbi:hypothetical protein [Flavobacterium mesophilum]|uniref:hypothetical protein n=1 Tax=Flavobacterium mesophilum TaxID=3143495 RepID=UPI0031D8A04D